MIRFILNGKFVEADVPAALPLVDFIRTHKRLTGTKIGCREGDCGACAVLEGELITDYVRYRTVMSCLTPMQNVYGKHIVTIEGLQTGKLSPVQQSFVDLGATQCGFCTPGFIVSLTAALLNRDLDPLQAIGGNICRCTGYASIERATQAFSMVRDTMSPETTIKWLVENAWLPGFFSGMAERLSTITPREKALSPHANLLGGGTDLMVQQGDGLLRQSVVSATDLAGNAIHSFPDRFEIGAATRITDFMDHTGIREVYPSLSQLQPLFASEPIRNMGTIAGNIVNASPIGDLSVFLMAVGAGLVMENKSGHRRMVPLREFYHGYKKTDLHPDEWISSLIIDRNPASDAVHFEKVSKRQKLDIASVNSAVRLRTQGDRIDAVQLVFGGVAPFPLLAERTGIFLTGKVPDLEVLEAAIRILQEEIKPISDIRGSASYKRLLVRQLFISHFMILLPQRVSQNEFFRWIKKLPLPHEAH